MTNRDACFGDLREHPHITDWNELEEDTIGCYILKFQQRRWVTRLRV